MAAEGAPAPGEAAAEAMSKDNDTKEAAVSAVPKDNDTKEAAVSAVPKDNDTKEAAVSAVSKDNDTKEVPPASTLPPIELARGDICSIDGLKATELNGLQCTLFREDTESGRWEVKLPDGEVKALRPAHLIFRSIGPIEDDGSLTLISMASDHQTIHRVLDSVRDLIRSGSEALALLASVVSPMGGRKAQGEEGRIWLKLAKQAENRVRGTLEDLQKNMEQVDGIDASRYGPKAAAEIRLARKDLVQFVQKAQEQLESGLARLRIVLVHLTSTVPSQKSAHGWTESESLHEKYRAAFEKLEEVVEKGDSSSLRGKTRLSSITVKFQGRGENPPPSDNLYVKGLPGWVTEADLESIFTEVGDIQSMKLKAADWGAIAFIRLANKTQAQRAIAKYNNRVPRLLEKKAEEVDAKRLSAEITKGMLRATVDQLARGITVIVDLRKPLGCVFNDHLVTKSVAEDGQGFELGIRVSWRVRSIGGIKLQNTNELKERMAKLKSEGLKEAAIVFSPPPIVASFAKRPFGFTVAKDADLGLNYVNASNGLARAQGVRPGALLSNIGGTDVSGYKIEQVRDMLLKADVPLSVHFEQARGLPNAVTGVLHPVPDEEMPMPPEEIDDGPMVVPPPVDLDIDLSQPLGLTFDHRLVVETVQKNSQASRLGIGPGWQVLGLAGDELSSRKELEQKLEVFKAEGSLGQSMMFQPTAVTAARAKELGAASAAALMRERALTLEREEEEVRKNMREVTLEVDLTQPLGILFNKFLEADQVNGGSQSARLGVQPGWRAVSLAGEKFKETRELVAKIQALKEEGTTAVSAVFLAPPLPSAPDAAPAAAPKMEEAKPKAMEVSMDLTLDLSQPLGIGFRDNLEAKEIKSGSQGASLGIEPGWRLVTLNGEALSNSKELVAKIKGLKSGGATSASSSWKRPAPEELQEVSMDLSEPLGVTWGNEQLVVQAVLGQAERLGIQPQWQLRRLGCEEVSAPQDFESKLKTLRESNGQAPKEVKLTFLVPSGGPQKRPRTEPP